MSIEINLNTTNKKELAQLLYSIADLIKVSRNNSVLFNGKIIFRQRKMEEI